MDQKTWDLLLADIKAMRSDIKDLKKDHAKLKFNVAFFGSVFGYVAAYLKTKFNL